MAHFHRGHGGYAGHAGRNTGNQQYPKKESVPVDWTTVVSWLKKNPHRRAPPPTVTASVSVAASALGAAAAPATAAENHTIWRQLPITPSTPLSCILYALNDNSYSENSETGRKEQLRTACTELQGRSDGELKGRAWPKAKTNEGLVEVAEKEVSPWSAIGLSALAELYKIQMIVLNETDKKIHYIPEDICSWDHERPIHFFAHNYRSVYLPPAGFGAGSMLAWLAEQEAAGWTFTVKEVKGTIEELNTLAAGAGLTLPAGKLKKDALIAHISRGLALAHIARWAAAVPE